MCRFFREMWALSARDKEINKQLVKYYKTLFNNLSKLFIAVCESETAAEKAASLLLPYFEGYSLTVGALPQEKQETAKMLAQLCCSFS